MIFMNWPKRCAATVGNVMMQEAKVVPISAYTFLKGLEMYANSVLQRMSGTPCFSPNPVSFGPGPLRSRPELMSTRALLTQKPGRMHAW